MENNERDRRLDQWLDEALSEYGAAEPRFGLEQRVLNRLRCEEQHSRKWNFWRWMPAFAAIAAVVVVAVAVRPMLEKKKNVQLSKSRIDTYSRPVEETPKSAATESVPKTATSPTTKRTPKADFNDTVRGAPLRRELAVVPQKKADSSPADRDNLVSAQAARVDSQLRATRSYEKNERASATGPVPLAGAPAASPAPPPPLPSPAQVQSPAGSGVGGAMGGGIATVTTAKPTPAKTPQGDLKTDAATAAVHTNEPITLNDKGPTQSVGSVIAKDSRRKEAHAKAEATLQNANTMEAFGVTVRFQNEPTGPTTQFPTPAPLSTQEKLALKAGPVLQDSAVAQHKSTVITPIEIKDVEIKPLEGPEKEK